MFSSFLRSLRVLRLILSSRRGTLAAMPAMDLPDPSKHALTVPLRPEDIAAPVSFGLILVKGDGGGSPFILLRQTTGALIFLGCIRDRDGLVLELCEVWVQDVPGLRASFRARLERITNESFDRHWLDRWQVRRQVSGAHVPRTGWEGAAVNPIVFEPAGQKVEYLQAPDSGSPLALCTDDSVLLEAGLPAYRGSLSRFLWNQNTAEPHFYQLASSEPLPAGVNPWPKQPDPKLVFNPGGGSLSIYPYAPFALPEYADLLAGKPWTGVRPEVIACLPAWYQGLIDPDDLAHGDSLFLHSRFGPSERLTETLLLKINLLTQAISQVETQTRIRQQPFLRLDQDSFRVHLAAPGPGLPAFWNARVELVADSAAERVSLGQTDLPYFLPPDALSPSVYQPKSTPVYQRSTATVRIREVLPSADGRTALDLTFATEDELPAAASDLVHLTLPAAGGSLDVYGHPDKPRGLAEREVRIRTLPQVIAPAVGKELERMAGLPLTKVPFELLPRLTSPYDLYALAVLGAKVLLSADENPLPIVIDELLSFAAQLASEQARQEPLRERIVRLFGQEARWSRTLGPQNVRR
ncbi:MAG: hypothetical protein JO015_07400, partial [Verrucomicrobia bacterium]|nr:hypothetical protein [Verrucomicrobiota bacterium]